MPARPDQLIEHLHGVLAQVLGPLGGDIEIVPDLAEASRRLLPSPARFLACLWWEGFGSHPEAENGMTEHRFAVVLVAARAFQINRNAEIWRHLPSGLPADSFLALLDLTGAALRALRWVDGWDVDPRGLAQVASDWIELPESARHRAHQLTFTLAAAAPPFDGVFSVPAP